MTIDVALRRGPPSHSRVPLCSQYAYPLTGMHECAYTEALDLSQPADTMMALGGFIYYDVNEAHDGPATEPTAVRAFVGPVISATELPHGMNADLLQGSLLFAGPHTLVELQVGDELFRRGRVHDVIDASLAAKGVQRFAWIHPKERIVMNGEGGEEVCRALPSSLTMG